MVEGVQGGGMQIGERVRLGAALNWHQWFGPGKRCGLPWVKGGSGYIWWLGKLLASEGCTDKWDAIE